MQWSWYKAALSGFREQQEGQWDRSGLSKAAGVGLGGWIGRETVQALALSRGAC